MEPEILDIVSASETAPADLSEVINQLGLINQHLSFLSSLSFITVVVSAVILTLMLFYTMLKRFF